MGTALCILWAAGLLAAEPQTTPAPSADDSGEVAAEPEGGTGVSPVELIPRIELRESYQKLAGGVSVHDTTAEMDIQFQHRLLLRYAVPHRLVETSMGQVSGFGDIELDALAIVISTPTSLFGLLATAVLNTASAPQLGAGKDQLSFGAGAAFKPRRWLLPYALVQEQFSVAGDSARPDVNELDARVGNILFGRQYNWLKLDLGTTIDFTSGSGRLFGTLEAGSLVIGRVGLFLRSGTQLLGQRQLDYSVAAGVRYLFRLEKGKPR